jgi:hypothetical protein
MSLLSCNVENTYATIKLQVLSNLFTHSSPRKKLTHLFLNLVHCHLLLIIKKKKKKNNTGSGDISEVGYITLRMPHGTFELIRREVIAVPFHKDGNLANGLMLTAMLH